MNIVIFGPQGVGKGTQAKLLASHYALKHISTGDALRESIKSGAPIGKIANNFIQKGEFVPDDVVNEIVEKDLAKHTNGWILDGYPRNLEQVEYLHSALEKLDQKIDYIIVLSAPHSVLVERMNQRREIENRSDDIEQIIEKRLELFREKTKPVLDYYNEHNIVKTLNGVGEIEEVNKYIIANIESLKQG
ncbi:MAG: adenylate kinase [Bifidobacteriaceae bacterium]|jgi:adenylate kinase|nr:adenylate kinase [Bifidobacteriaceae bacterium]